MATNYQRGRAFEYRTRDKLLKDGAVYVMRAAQSKGKVDLIALWPYHESLGPQVSLIQCKRDGRLSVTERDALLDLAEQTWAEAYVAKTGPNGRGVVLQRLSKEAQ